MSELATKAKATSDRYRSYLERKLPVAGEVLLEAARRHGTPSYVYVEEAVRRRCRLLAEHFEGLPVRLLYAMKANANPAVLQCIRAEGFGLDVVSPGELALAQGVGFAADDMLFSANNMTDQEMAQAHEKGVLLNIGELSRLKRFGEAFPGSDVCLRLNPQVGGGHHRHVVTAGERSKFGIPVGRLEEAQQVARTYDLRIKGLHQHIGSGILEAKLLWEAMRVMLEAAEQVASLSFINFGGGFGVPYREDETALDLAELRSTIEAPLQAFAQSHPSEHLTYWFEPGRYLVALAGVLLMRVNTLKEAHGRRFAGTDSGMGHLLRPAVYGAHHAVFNLSNPDGPLQSYDVTGNICEAGDVFAEDRPVQQIREGDVLAVLDAGGYGMVMASEYNLRPRPAEVFLQEDGRFRRTRPRQSPEALAAERLRAAGIQSPVT